MDSQQEQFAAWYRGVRDPVFRTLVAVTCDGDAAAEVTAEAFTRAYENWPHIRDHPNPTAWVVRTALNLQRSRWRRLRLERRPRPSRSDAADDNIPFDPALRALVLGLPRRQREVVALRLLADLSTEQTAHVLGIAPGTVTAHLHRGVTSLRAALAGPIRAAAIQAQEEHR